MTKESCDVAMQEEQGGVLWKSASFVCWNYVGASGQVRNGGGGHREGVRALEGMPGRRRKTPTLGEASGTTQPGDHINHGGVGREMGSDST